MNRSTRPYSCIEALETRITPAVVLTNLLPDIVAGIGKTGATVDLSQLTAPLSASAYHSKVQFVTNYDTDPNTAGIQAGVIEIELFDNEAPLTVQNFLAYVNNSNARGDYDDTLFHRAIPGFVLQGGGFESTAPSVQIPRLPAVHNEPDIVNRSNVAGTIAMAKIGVDDGGSPHTATSEWFINLVNNDGTGANNLNTQNGGFTVFGKVTGDGLALANTIANLDKRAGTNTPVQNGVPIKVVDAIVTPPPAAAVTGVTYSVDSITVAGTTTKSTLVTGKITGSQLALTYAAGRSGVVDIKVRITDGTDTKFDTFRVDVRPNLTIQHFDADALIPGDLTPLDFKLVNNGAARFSGNVTVKLTMVKVGDSTVVDLGQQVVPVNVASGAAQILSIKAKVPQRLATVDGETYQVTAEILPAAGERFTDDNAATLGDNGARGTRVLSNTFGAFDGRTNVALKYLDANGKLLTWTMKGAGAGQLTPNGSGGYTLRLEGTNLASAPTMLAAGGAAPLTLAGIEATNPVGAVNLPTASVNGAIIASAGLKTLTLGNMTPSGQALVLLGTPVFDGSVKAALRFGNVSNVTIQSEMPLASLTVANWADPAGSVADTITAPSLGRLVVTNDFDAALSLTDEDTPLASVTIGGTLKNASIQTAGDIGTVRVGAISKSSVFAGVTARPTGISAFADPQRIASFTVTGIRGFSGPLFDDSQVAAQTIGTISVRGIAPAASGAPASGFAADVINSYARVGTATKTRLTADYDDGADGQVGAGYVVKIF